MHIYSKIAILIVFILFAILLFYFIQNGHSILTQEDPEDQKNQATDSQEPYKEGFFFATENADLTKMKSTIGTEIRPFTQSIYADITNSYPKELGQYAIKSSYNSAYTGSFISLDAIKYVLSRGCRLLDFEIFLIDGKACVASTTDPTNKIYTSKNYILLDDVLNCVAISGFNPSNCPNSTDPLFIQLRIQSQHEDLYEFCAIAVSKQLSQRLAKDENANILLVDKNTHISDLIGKVVIIVDKKLAPDYAQLPDCKSTDKNCFNLKNYVNMESGGDNLKLYTYPSIFDYAYTPYETQKHLATGIKTLKIIIPEVNTNKLSNPMALSMVVKYSMHMICSMFYNLDDSLKNYERVFAANGSAFLSLADAEQLMNNADKEPTIAP
jgi:hypothetical protein